MVSEVEFNPVGRDEISFLQEFKRIKHRTTKREVEFLTKSKPCKTKIQDMRKLEQLSRESNTHYDALFIIHLTCNF